MSSPVAPTCSNSYAKTRILRSFPRLTGSNRNAGRCKRREADRKLRAPEVSSWKRQLSDLLHAGLQHAKYEQNIEIDLVLRVALVKFLTQEIITQFANLMLEAKEWIRSRGGHFDHTEQAHVIKARLAELQADRRNMFRQTGHTFIRL